MVEIGTSVCRTPGRGAGRAGPAPGAGDGAGRPERAQDRRRGHPPVLQLDGAGDHAARALPRGQGGPGGPGPAAADLRDPRAHRHRGPGLPDRRDERLRATSCRTSSPLHQFALLDGPGNRPQVLPERGLPELPPDRRSPGAPWLGRVRAAGRTPWCAPTACPTDPRSGGTCGPTTAIPTLEFRVCDVCTRVDEAVCIAAILQAIIAKLWKMRRDNLDLPALLRRR